MNAKEKVEDKVRVKSHSQMSNPEICIAVSNRLRMQFKYHGKERIVEPQCYGITKTGKESVRCYMIEGGTRNEQLVDLSKMKRLQVLDEYIYKPGPNYVKDDSAFITIFCQL